MPPDYGKLPIPKKAKNQDTIEEKSIKSLIVIKKNNLSKIDSQNESTNNVEKSLLEKIKNN